MPANTAKGYPYPLGTDRVMDGDDAIKNLATAVDTKLGVTCSGTAVINVVTGGTTASLAVTFPAGAFTVSPAVVTNALTGNPANGQTTPSPVSATGFTANVIRNSAGTINVLWIASQT